MRYAKFPKPSFATERKRRKMNKEEKKELYIGPRFVKGIFPAMFSVFEEDSVTPLDCDDNGVLHYPSRLEARKAANRYRRRQRKATSKFGTEGDKGKLPQNKENKRSIKMSELLKRVEEMSKTERSLLLFFEACLVDHNGKVNTRHINDEDSTIAKQWSKEGLILYGRICFDDIKGHETHYVRFSENAWTMAHYERRRRSDRMFSKTTYGLVAQET